MKMKEIFCQNLLLSFSYFQGPYRHYILNALWILINLLCIFLTLYQLKRLYRDFTAKNLAAVRIAGLFTSLLSIQTEVGRGWSYQETGKTIGILNQKTKNIKSFLYIMTPTSCNSMKNENPSYLFQSVGLILLFFTFNVKKCL